MPIDLDDDTRQAALELIADMQEACEDIRTGLRELRNYLPDHA